MMFKFVILACVAQATLGEFNVKFNSLLDGQLALVNQMLAKQNVHSVPLGDVTADGADIKGISLSDIATFQRIGDAVMQATDDSTLQVTSSFGLADLVYHIDSYTSPKLSYQNASFVVKTNAGGLSYTVSFTPSGGCSMTVQELEITELTDVTMYSNDPKMNGIDVSSAFVQVKTTINNYLKSPNFVANLQQHDPCKSNPTEWAKLFKVGF